MNENDKCEIVIDFHFIYFHFMLLVKFTLPYLKGIKYRYIYNHNGAYGYI